MMSMEKVEFEFPDEQESKKAKGKRVEVPEDEVSYEVEADKPEVEVVDDTPPKDRNRKPMKEAPEDVTEEELAEYSEKVQHRLKHFSRGYHDERRAKEAAQREKDEAVRFAQQVMNENRAIQERLRLREEEGFKHALETAAKAKEDAERKVKTAYEAGDADALVAANAELAHAIFRSNSLNERRPPEKQSEKTLQQPNQVVASQSRNAQPQVDPRAAEWQAKNAWFGTDDEMTSFALGLHQKLLKQGVDPRSDEYYDRLNGRMREVFPDQFDEPAEEPELKEKPKKANVVAPATRSTAPRKIVLTASQVAIAKRLGVPLELYAKQVANEMRK